MSTSTRTDLRTDRDLEDLAASWLDQRAAGRLDLAASDAIQRAINAYRDNGCQPAAA